MKSKKVAALDLAKLCCRVLDDKKAGELTVLDVSEQSSITDFLVIATATSDPHLRALRVELEKALDAGKVHLVGMESAQESGWMVVDAFDVMIHLFLSEARERYGLERLWRDATEVSVPKLLAAPKERKSAPAKAKPKAAVKPRAAKSRRSPGK
ncbi:MAG: ribosome silencing factor [Verrucomicrobiota bacterium]|jgi:ribosome-associated protein